MDIRVRTMDCAISGMVSSCPIAAAIAAYAGTPGIISNGIPSAFKRRICSAIAPYNDGSPECTRATSWPRLCAAKISAWVSSNVITAVSLTIASLGAQATTASGTNDPAYKHTGHSSIFALAFTVIKSGSPGPAPIKNTVMTNLHQFCGHNHAV